MILPKYFVLQLIFIFVRVALVLNTDTRSKIYLKNTGVKHWRASSAVGSSPVKLILLRFLN